MKNFRKVLALVLAVATLFSFTAMASAAKVTFTDAGEVAKAEAVDVLVGLGVINGRTDGSFDPKGDVTRAEMATMISKIMNKGEDVNARWTNANTFADMAGVEWAAGHVAFNASEGYIAGRNATTFAPNDKVTGAEAAKMLLCALGYDATYNGLVGADWSKNTVKLASKLGLFENVDSKPEENLNRENAAQVLLNALEAPIAEFTPGAQTTVGGVTVVTGGEQETKVYDANGAQDYSNCADTDLTVTYLIETLFAATKTSAIDWAGREGHQWNYGVETYGPYGAGEIFKTYTGPVTLPTLFADLGENAGSTFTGGIKVYRNGAEDAQEAALVAGMNRNSTKYQAIAAAGDTVEVYYDMLTKTLRIVEVRPFIGEILSVDAEGTATVDVAGIQNSLTLADTNYSEETTDVMVVAYVSETLGAGNEVLVAIEEAKAVTGTLSNYAGTVGTDLTLVIDGTVYTTGANVQAANLQMYLGKQVTVLTDASGLVLAVNAADLTAEMKYALVIDTGISGIVGMAKQDLYATLMFANGEVKTVQVKETTTVNLNTLANLEGIIVTYTENSGVYNLVAAADGQFITTNVNSLAGLTAGQSTIDSGVAATNNTVFVVDTYTAGAEDKGTVYTGVKNAPQVTSLTSGTIKYLAVDGVALVVFVYNGNLGSVSTADIDVIYVHGQERLESVLDANGERVEYKTFAAVIDGATTTVKVRTDAAYEDLNDDFTTAGWRLFNGSKILDGYYVNIDIASFGMGMTQSITPAQWVRYKDGIVYTATNTPVAVDEDQVTYTYNVDTEKLEVTTIAKVTSKLDTNGTSFYLLDQYAPGNPVDLFFLVINP